MCGIFAKAVARNEGWLDTFFLKHTPGGDRDSQDRGLRVFCQSKLIVGTFIAELGKFQA